MKPHPSDLARGTARRRRCPFRVPLMLLAAVGVPLASPAGAGAEPAAAPDSAQVALVRFAALSFEDVQVVTDGTKLVGHRVVVSPQGLELRSSSGTSISSPPEVRLVPWREIESIQVRRGSSGTSILVCGVLGLMVGAAIAVGQAQAAAFTFTPQKVSGTPILVGLAGGATLGWMIDRPGPWRSVYP